MHELAVCQGLLNQVEQIADQHKAGCVDRILLAIGPLSGVEPPLLESAFTVARCGTRAENAVLEIRPSPVRVQCRQCGHEGEARPNRLLCSECGGWQVNVVSGEEMMLMSLELSDLPDESAGSAEDAPRGAISA